jgi:hypothetical protein
MNIPAPPAFGPPRLRKILGDIRKGIMAAQPKDGHNITTQETPYGTIVNAERIAGALVCPFEATLVCDSISASKSKCGYLPMDNDFANGFGCSLGATGHFTHFSVDCDGSCSLTGTVSGDAFFLGKEITILGCPSGCTDTHEIDVFDRFECSSSVASVQHDDDCPADDDTSISSDYVLSSEYTTALLISDTETLLPAYDDDFDDDCLASRDLSDNEAIYTIQRFKYKFTFPAATTQCTLSWIERFTPDVGGIVDTPMSEVIEIGQTETAVYQVLEPAEDGEITIVYPVP